VTKYSDVRPLRRNRGKNGKRLGDPWPSHREPEWLTLESEPTVNIIISKRRLQESLWLMRTKRVTLAHANKKSHSGSV
jgi:hypothetical protein